MSQTGSDLNWAACESSSAFLLSLLGIGEAEVKPGSKPGHSIEDHVHFSLCYLGTLNRHICEQEFISLLADHTAGHRKKKERKAGKEPTTRKPVTQSYACCVHLGST